MARYSITSGQGEEIVDETYRDDSRDVDTVDSLATVLEQVRKALRGLKFGHVSLIVQDGRVVQVDRFEKTRLTKHSGT